MIKFIDLFAGIGGFRLALTFLGCECVFSSEFNPHCKKVYEMNYGEVPHGDITEIDPKTIPDHDIICAGFPCQPFSSNGKQKGFEDSRGTLFYNILEIAKIKKPKVLFLENVKNLVHHDSGKTFEVMRTLLSKLNYKVTYKVLNAKDFGLAQNRERTIIVASNKEFDFSLLKKENPIYLKDIIEDVDYPKIDNYTIIDKWTRQKSGLVFCGYMNKNTRKGKTNLNSSGTHCTTNRIYHVDGVSPTMLSQDSSGRYYIYNNKFVRKLTINECFKLQGFPENFKKLDNKGICYSQMGNAVPVNMIKAVGKEIINQLINNV